MIKLQPNNRAQELMIGLFKDNLSKAEMDELDEWILASDKNMHIFETWVKKDNRGEPLPIINYHQRNWLAAAAIGGILILISELLPTFTNKSIQAGLEQKGQEKRQSRTVSTLPNEQTTILLSDSSQVILFGGSSLQYPTPFPPNRRYVDLKGNAHFDVNFDTTTRLRVYVNDYTMISRNGNFTVHASSTSDSIQISLQKGDLMFTAGKNSWILEPGRTAIYSKGVWQTR